MLDKIVGKSAFKKCVGEVLRTVSDQCCQIISILDRKLNSGTCSIAAPADSTYLITLLCSAPGIDLSNLTGAERSRVPKALWQDGARRSRNKYSNGIALNCNF